MQLISFVKSVSMKPLKTFNTKQPPHNSQVDTMHVHVDLFIRYKQIGYNINVLQQTACLVVNPITVDNFVFLFNCKPVGRTSNSMAVPT